MEYASVSRRTLTRDSHGTVRVMEPNVQQMTTLIEEHYYIGAVDSIDSSLTSIDHYSDISLKSHHGRDMSYETLDQQVVQQLLARQPNVYDELAVVADVE